MAYGSFKVGREPARLSKLRPRGAGTARHKAVNAKSRAMIEYMLDLSGHLWRMKRFQTWSPAEVYLYIFTRVVTAVGKDEMRQRKGNCPNLGMTFLATKRHWCGWRRVQCFAQAVQDQVEGWVSWYGNEKRHDSIL